jgi:hypothetical protein
LAAATLSSTVAAGATIPVNIGSQYSDLWWNPQESGWGMNIVQQGETAFVTLFVYGPDDRPTWYVASDARVFAVDASGNPAFRGTLYKTTGPWMGGPFDSAKVRLQPVGQLVIEPRVDGRLNLTYSAEGISVSKDVVRSTFSAPDIGATYHGSFSLRQAVPGGTPYGTRQYGADVLVHLEGDVVFMRVEEPFSRCEYRGTRVPSGRYAQIDGAYSCAAGESGTFAITEFEVTEHGITGYLRTYSATNNQYGRFAAARY